MTEDREPVMVVQDNETKDVILEAASYEETLALLKILTLGSREIEEGKIEPIADVVKRLRAKKTPA
ncbi:MAG: antitoxin, Phd family protein [Sterolibacterium sp.]|jgi:hypothetical protein